MGKEFHVYFTRTHDDNILYHYFEVATAIECNQVLINTTLTDFISTKLLEKGYRIFIHTSKSEIIEIKLGCDNTYINKEIRMEHNIRKMLLAGSFGEL